MIQIILFIGLTLLLSIIVLLVCSLVQGNKFQEKIYKNLDEIRNDYTEKIKLCIEGQKSLESEIANKSKMVSETIGELSDSVDDYNEEVTRKIELIKYSIQELANKQKNNSIPQIYALLAGMEEVEQKEDIIYDKETTYTLTNIYKKGVLVTSSITNLEGKVIYEIKYDSNGEIETSLSYDNNGNKRIQQFFANGKLTKRQTFHGDKIDLHTFA